MGPVHVSAGNRNLSLRETVRSQPY